MTMEFKIPVPLKKEHDELHAFLNKATKLNDKTGEAAKVLARLMHPHFIKEEEFALPALGLLPGLATGADPFEMMDVLELTDKLKKELPQMLDEHQQIMKALDALIAEASAEHHDDVIAFANQLKLHAQTEEEVSYPAAILIGEYLKLRQKQGQ